MAAASYKDGEEQPLRGPADGDSPFPSLSLRTADIDDYAEHFKQQQPSSLPQRGTVPNLLQRIGRSILFTLSSRRRSPDDSKSEHDEQSENSKPEDWGVSSLRTSDLSAYTRKFPKAQGKSPPSYSDEEELRTLDITEYDKLTQKDRGDHSSHSSESKPGCAQRLKSRVQSLREFKFESILHPEFTDLKDQDGLKRRIVTCYGKAFAYKQLIALGILSISWILMVSAFAIDSWSKCEGVTNTMQTINVYWGHNEFRIAVGEYSTESIKYDEAIEVVRHLHSEAQDSNFIPLPTPFDADYDPSRWDSIAAELHRQKNRRDMISLLILSENKLIPDIAYWLGLELPFNVTLMLIIPALTVLITMWDDRFYRSQYAVAATIAVFCCIVLMCYGHAMPFVDGYNPSLTCFRGNSLVVHSAGFAQFSTLFFLFTVPRAFNVAEFNTVWIYRWRQEQRKEMEAKRLKEEEEKLGIHSDDGSTVSAVSLGDTARGRRSRDRHSNDSGHSMASNDSIGNEDEEEPLVDSDSVLLESLPESDGGKPVEDEAKSNVFGTKGLFKKIGDLMPRRESTKKFDDIDIESDEGTTVSLGDPPQINEVEQRTVDLSADSGTGSDSVVLGQAQGARLP